MSFASSTRAEKSLQKLVARELPAIIAHLDSTARPNGGVRRRADDPWMMHALLVALRDR